MPRRCCVPGCKNNYDSTIKEKGLVTTFSFPNNEYMRQSWIKAIPRKNWTPSSSAVVCAEHFEVADVLRTERVVDGDGCVSQPMLKRPKLKGNAIPRYFGNLPSYLSKPAPVTRPDPEVRRHKVEERQDQAVRDYMNSDMINSFEEFSDEIYSLISPPWNLKKTSESVSLFVLEHANSENNRLVVKCSIIVNNDLVMKVYLGSNELSSNDLKWDLTNDQKFSRWSQLENILSHYGSDSTS